RGAFDDLHRNTRPFCQRRIIGKFVLPILESLLVRCEYSLEGEALRCLRRKEIGTWHGSSHRFAQICPLDCVGDWNGRTRSDRKILTHPRDQICAHERTHSVMDQYALKIVPTHRKEREPGRCPARCSTWNHMNMTCKIANSLMKQFSIFRMDRHRK